MAADGKRGAMRITKVYTRTGDDGTSRLADGTVVAKDDLRLEAYGTIDELNAAVGLVRAFTGEIPGPPGGEARLDGLLHRVQDRLFDIGAILATPPGAALKGLPILGEAEIARLEGWMDRCHTQLAPLEEFILPGGGKGAAFLHQARTICRRAERICVRLNRTTSVPSVLLRYLNRLSDLFFVLSRWTAKQEGVPETLWRRTPAPDG